VKEAKERIEQINIKIGNNLLKTRLAAGVNTAQLSKKVYVTRQQITKYESGINQIPIGRLVLIAEALEVNITSFFDGICDLFPAKKVKARKRLCADISRNLVKIKNHDTQKTIHKIVKEIVNSQDFLKE
jgi:transcriptional regulator with XRE-family HTH domain